MKPAWYPNAPKQGGQALGLPRTTGTKMILGKELLEHGKVTKDGSGLAIDPGAPYVRTINNNWFRSGTQPGSRLHLVQRPWGLARRTEVEPPVVDPDKPSERASFGDTLPEVPPTN